MSPSPPPSWFNSFNKHGQQWSEVRLICSGRDGQPCTLMTFLRSILISKWRCFCRFDEVKSIHFPAQRGPLSCLPFVLTLGDNHIADLSRAWLHLCLSPSDAAAGLAWTARESTPQKYLSWNRKKERGRGNQSSPRLLLKEKGWAWEWVCVG